MLVISRKEGERIKIGDDITITVHEVSRQQIRFGIEAPRDISVHREEVYLKIQSEQLSTIQSNG